MIEDNNRIEYTMGVGKANIIAFFMIFPILLIFFLPYYFIWEIDSLEIGIKLLMKYGLLIVLSGIVVHEFLHGITWSFFATKGFKSIKFGVNWKWLTPYCHCKEGLKVKHYMLGGIMPLLVMGIIPAIIALFIGNGSLLVFGIFFIWAAGGDIISFFMLIRLDQDAIVFDHPDKLGFYKEILQED